MLQVGWINLTESLISGDILCFYEVLNPHGGLAGMLVKESRERSIDNYVQWAQQQQLALPPGHSFYRAMWVKVTDSRLKEPFIPDKVPFKINKDGSVMLNDDKFWLDHIFTLYGDDKDAGKHLDDASSEDFLFEEE